MILVELEKKDVALLICEVSDDRNNQFKLLYLVTKKQERKPQKKKGNLRKKANMTLKSSSAMTWKAA